jgi:hypothetical protein
MSNPHAKKTQKPTEPPPNDSSDPLFGDATPTIPAGALALKPQTETRPGVYVDDAKTVTRRDSTGTELEGTRESAAVGAQTKAEIAARTLQAMQNPRSFDEARFDILRDCQRPGFAKAAVYSLPPRGDGKRIEGLSIRFAEAAIAHWGNTAVSSHLIFEDSEKRVVRITVSDLQKNVVFERDITIAKIVERKQLRRGQEPLGQRTNSQGEIVFTVRATEEEVQFAEGRERSRVVRNEGLRLIPADLKEEAIALCRATARNADAKDPDAERKKLADAFGELGVRPPDIAAYIGCDIGQAVPAQLQDLRDVYISIRDGEATWQEFVSARTDDLAPAEEREENGGSAVASLKERALKVAAERKAAAKVQA